MNDKSSNPPKRKRRELAPLEPVDAQDGPAMRALPTDRHRAFVRAMYQVKPGHGAAVRAAKLAGFGTPQSSPQSMATIASRLTHDERVQAAFSEQDQLFIRASAPRAIRALSSLIENPRSKDHARGIAMVLDRTMPAEQVHKVKHEHDVTPNAMETARIMERIAELSAKFAVILPAPMRQIGGPIIDGEATLISQAGGGQ
jgi:phage terminase small subunit